MMFVDQAPMHTVSHRSHEQPDHPLARSIDLPMKLALASVLFAAQFGIWFGTLHWSLELLSHFQLQYWCVAMICLSWFGLRRNVYWSAAALTGGMLMTLSLWPFWSRQVHTTTELHTTTEPGTFRIATVNLNVANHDHEAATSVLTAMEADVIVVQEVTPRWAAALASLKRYPFRWVEPRSDGFGIAILSQRPLVTTEVLNAAGVPFIKAQFQSNGNLLTVLAVHPLPPVGSRYSTRRNRQLEKIVAWCKQIDGPLIVAGDFNCTPFSPYFKSLLEATELIDTRLGAGIQPSWPQLWPLKIPIDHVLVSKHFQVSQLQLAGQIGSDHTPVLCDLVLRLEKP